MLLHDPVRTTALRTIVRDADDPVAPTTGTEPDESVHTVLAAQARSHTTGELWRTVVGSATNAVLLWTQFPSFHWLAAAFAAVTAYGCWGLADRAISVSELPDSKQPLSDRLIGAARGLAVAGGWVAAIGAAAMLLTALVSRLSLPGG